MTSISSISVRCVRYRVEKVTPEGVIEIKRMVGRDSGKLFVYHDEIQGGQWSPSFEVARTPQGAVWLLRQQVRKLLQSSKKQYEEAERNLARLEAAMQTKEVRILK